MKQLSPRQVVFLCATLIAGITALLLFLVEVQILPLLLVSAGVAIAAYFILFYVLQQYIFQSINGIFRQISSAKQPSDEPYKRGIMSLGYLKHVEQEALEWAEDHKKEIEHFRQLAAYRKEFVSNVSHELKTPLFNLQGYLHTLIDGGIDDPEINSRFLEKAASNAQRLEHLIKDLDIITSLESGKLVLHREKFDLLSLTHDVLESMELKASNRSISLTFKKVYKTPFMVVGDRERVRQVLVNLIDNSIKYGKEDGSTNVGFFDMDENILTEITDDGYGIDTEHLPRIFERFYRIDKGRSRDNGGTGLGLAIVKHIIEAHGQSIHVRSKAGVGTTFGFTLKKADHA